jgi:hypothetical protein
MLNDQRIRYSLGSLFWIVAAIAAPLGLSAAWRGDKALIACIGMATVLLVVTRRKLFGFALMMYLTVVVLACLFVFHELATQGPYVRRYNEQLEKMSINAGLIGSDAKRVEEVLGPATFVYKGWDQWHSDTGKPGAHASYVITYNYAPYPSLPACNFQVHCMDGKVQSIELYDD